ncbi:hypothetical protein LC087_04295 [Bacillus carboniphilus]|uniref:DUF4309 domain-containing protein n=1 Tax=Bacillus carboniphilus TaxID=86663 RepID=A0ABY9JVH5_9BACI|nr:hypothetical protein [Bacillus carboniphilus]WLR43406.1 hypothetical protein LC087_04295 [Bacillus carboniphilus]
MRNQKEKQQSELNKMDDIETINNKVNHDSEEIPLDENEEETLFLGESKFRTGFGLLSIVFLVITILTTTTLTEEEALAEIKNRSSESITSSFKLTAETKVQLESQDFEVTDFEGNGTARMLIWDFTGHSGNEVQILVDGQVIRDVHILNDNVAAYSVPVPSVVTIRGLDSTTETPIQYAVKFPDRKQTLFNVVPIEGTNQYTLVPRF